MPDLMKILVPELPVNVPDLSSLVALSVKEPNPLVILCAEGTVCGENSLSLFEAVARDFAGRIAIFWIDICARRLLREIFSGQNLPFVLVMKGGAMCGTFSCRECWQRICDLLEWQSLGRDWRRIVAPRVSA